MAHRSAVWELERWLVMYNQLLDPQVLGKRFDPSTAY